MATADLITSFLSNEMSPEREREFLLSVAASDTLRLELKSHMLLDRILLGQAQRARVPDGVRATIFAAAGVGTAAATTSVAQAAPADPRPVDRPGFFARFGGRMALLVAAAGFFGLGYYAGGELVPDQAARAAGTIRSEQPAVSADRVRNAPTLQIRDRESAPATATRETAPTVRRGADAPSSGVEARRSAAPSDIADPTVSAPVGSPTTQTPPAAVVKDDPRRDPARATVRGTIEKPTEEQRNSQSTPADPRK